VAAKLVGPVPSEPSQLGATQIALVRRGEPVTVGMKPEEAFRIFKDPGRLGFERNDLPPGFPEGYRARTWEAESQGFGVITFNDRIVVAMYQEERANQERVSEFVRVHQERMGQMRPQIINGRRVSYWFWELDGQRLMICAFQTERDGVRITTSMGDAGVLEALGVNYDRALRDQEKIDRALTQPTAGEKTSGDRPTGETNAAAGRR